MGTDFGCGGGGDARSRHEPAAQPLAALSVALLPHLGAFCALSVERRVRLSRPTAGCDGPGACTAGYCTCANPARRAPPVRGRRCPALVAPSVWARRAHAHQRRPALAAL